MPVGPADIVIAGGPPIELPGTVLWLDGNFGVARASDQVRAWTDRSGYGHVFEREALEEPGVSPDRLGDHGAIRFGGRARLVLSRAIDDKARAALTIGVQDFLIALVLQQEGGRTPAVVFALAPRIEPDMVPALGSFFSLELGQKLMFTFTGGNGDSRLEAPAAEGQGPQLLVITGLGPRISLRIEGNGKKLSNDFPLGRRAGQRLDGPPLELPFLVPYLGGWDYDLAALTGVIAEVVLVAGPGVEAANAPLETYLRQKYGF